MQIVNPSTPISGFVVQGDICAPFSYKTIYKGASYRESWPLDGHNDIQSDKITTELNELFYKWDNGNFKLWMCEDISIIKTYNSICKDNGIKTRILSVRTKKHGGRAYDEIINEIPLGFDFVSPSFDYSAIADDFISHNNLFTKFTKIINKFGLFNNAQDINAYIEYRNILLNNRCNIERNDTLEVVMLSDITI